MSKLEIRLAAVTAASAFQTRGWTWSKTHPRSPSVDEIEECLSSLVDDLAAIEGRPEGYSTATGRLYADIGEDGDVHLSMSLGTLEAYFAEDKP